MLFTKNVLLASALALASSVNAHMKMLTPVPFGNSTLNNFPLAADGSDFPCKQRPGVYDATDAKNAPMPIGAPQTLSFLGGATHGGGSCQVSLTTDKNPTKDTKWQVIHSIMGDCPSNFDGNQGESASDLGATKFQYTIPEGIKPGDYVLAWTWFNRIGNREMYMNCAPITVTAGSKKRSAKADITKRQASFPDMFKANIGNGCTTAEGGNVIFPDPGASVQKLTTFPSKDPVGSCGTGTSAATNTNSGSSGSGSSPAPAPESSAAPSAPAPAPVPSASAPAPAPSVAAPAPSAPAPAPASPVGTAPAAPVAPATPEAPPPAGVNTTKGSCTAPGQSVCSPDGKQIGTCDGTNHVTYFPVAQGTICSGGYMVMAGSTGKRSARFAHGPARRSYPLARW